MTNQPRSDADNKRKLDQLVPEWESYRSQKIRAEADKERADHDVQATNQEADEYFGTHDPAEIDRMIEEERARNTAEIDAFADVLARIRTDLAAIEEPTR